MKQHSRYFYRECVILLIMGLFLTSTINVLGWGTSYDEYYSLDSRHPYTNDYDYTWEIYRPGASYVFIRFSKIEIESYYDHLYVRDKNNNLVWQSETRNVGKKTYTNLGITVTGDTAKVRLKTDYSVTYYGFRIDYIGFDKNEWIESPHNYPNNYDRSWYVSTPSANKMQLWFSKLDVETSYDHLYLYDDSGTLVWSYTNPGSWPGTPQYEVFTPWFWTTELRIRLVTDSSITGYGFRVYVVTTKLGDDDGVLEVAVYGVGNYVKLEDLSTDNADKFREKAIEAGWQVKYDLRDSQVDDHHFYNEGNTVDLMFFTGHGDPATVCLDGYGCWWIAQSDKYWKLYDEHTVGSDDWEWAIFISCNVMSSSSSKEMLYHGGHGIYGYRTVCSGDSEVERRFWVYAYEWGQEIGWSFSEASHMSKQYGVRGWMHAQNEHDHLWGCGKVYPDCTNNNDIIYRDYD